jgi:acetyl esterase/lipase
LIITGFIFFNIYRLEAGESTSNSIPHLTINSYIQDIVNHPAFAGFGKFLLTRNDDSHYYDTPLSRVNILMPYHNHVRPDVVLDALNHMIDEVGAGKIIFYDFYSERQKQVDPTKSFSGLFFFRGKPGAPFAIICPGGGFSYVGSLHEGFPIAQEISRQGYNAFVIRYRIGGEKIACEDLAAAIAYIFSNAAVLNVSTQNYSLWGGSAGARVAARLASSGTAAYGEANLPKPGMAVIAYTGHTAWTHNDPPTFTLVGDRDGIANPAVMERRVHAMKGAGIPTEFHLYRNVGHGFALGVGTTAEGWTKDAIRFWEKHMTR